MDLTEAEDIKKRWQEYTEELYKRDLHDPDNHDGVITHHLEPDILECKVRWALGSITMNKAIGGDGIPVAAAAKLLLSCPVLYNPIDGSLPGSPIPGILQVRTLEWVAISFSNAWKWKVKVKLLSCVRIFMTPWTAAYQASPSMGFSRQEYWSGLPLPSPGIPVELFQILKDDAVKVLHSICQQIWKTQQWPQTWNEKVSLHSNF